MRKAAPFLLALALGCSADELLEIPWPENPSQPVQQDLVISPASGVFFVNTSTGQPAMADYTVTTKAGKDVSSKVTMSAQQSPFGSFAGTAFTSTRKRPKTVTGLGYSSLINATLPTGEVGYAWSTLVFLDNDTEGAGYVVQPDGSLGRTKEVLRLDTRVRVDLAVVMDTTGSMGGAIENLKTNLTTKLFPSLKAAVPNAGLAVVDFRDYPVGLFGSNGDFPALVRTPITGNVAVAQAAVNLLSPGGGADLPEAHLPAMYYTLTGKQLVWPTGALAAAKPPSGTFGGVHFREHSLPVVALITDVGWHVPAASVSDPKEAEGEYPTSVTAPSFEEVADAFRSTKAVFVNVTTEGNETQANALSDEINSSVPPSVFGDKCGGQCCTGAGGAGREPKTDGKCRLNFLHSNGSGVSDLLVTAVTSIMAGRIYDVRLEVSNLPENPAGFDAAKLFSNWRLIEEGDASKGCAPRTATDQDGDGKKETFLQVPYNTPLCYEFTLPSNVGLSRGDKATLHGVRVALIGQPDNTVLEERILAVVVPPKDLVAK